MERIKSIIWDGSEFPRHTKVRWEQFIIEEVTL